jgi:hypothetical protein
MHEEELPSCVFKLHARTTTEANSSATAIMFSYMLQKPGTIELGGWMQQLGCLRGHGEVVNMA